MPAKIKPAHYRGPYHVESRRVRQQANANPVTTCWRCGLTLAEHKPHKNGKPARWMAGHVIDGQVGGPLLPEASTCNLEAGARTGNRKRLRVTSRDW